MTQSFKVYGQHDDNTLAQMTRCMEIGSAVGGVLCADGHLGYAHPIGGVVAYEEHISISGVGFDIACGNMAVKTNLRFSNVQEHVGTIMDDIARLISFGIGRRNAGRVEHPLFDSELWRAADVEALKPVAREQLGTVGSGNHYVDLFEDEAGAVWVGVHFGSRGLGHKITTKYLALAGAKDGMMVDPAVVGADTDVGRGYIAGIELGGLYAYAGREWVIGKVLSILGAAAVDAVHNHHNWAWRERHGGRDLWVVRKGATPAFPGQRGFVGGSMGDNAVILRGLDTPEAAASLFSTVHGAGRIMSRADAKGRFKRDPETGKKIRMQGRVRHDEMMAWVAEKGVTLRGADLDEAPQAYRRLPEVLAEHAGTIEIEHTLRPFGVVMAGADIVDPYKD